MNTSDAIELIRRGVPPRSGTWADLGAGDGMFTRALAERVGPSSRIYAIDRDADALVALGRWAAREAPGVIPVLADFAHPFALPGAERGMLDGLLLANSLHFMPDAEQVLARLAQWLRPGGRLVLVEYDRRHASPWVPYPIPSDRFISLAARAGFSAPALIAKRPSAFGGELYAAAARRLAEVVEHQRDGRGSRPRAAAQGV